MKKTNFKNLLVVLFTVIMVFVLTMSFVACSKTDDTTTEETKKDTTTTTTDTALIKNGDFATFTGTTAPFSAGTWKTSSGSSTNTENKKGVVHTGALFAAENSSFADVSDPGLANPNDKDNTVYMLYNAKEDTTSVYQSFNTAIGGYYKVTLDFKVVGVSEEFKDGLYVTFSGNVYKKFGPFTPSENNKWDTITMYIESSYVESQSVTVTMSLGDTVASTKAVGCAFFDNVVAEKIQKSDYEKAESENTNKLTSFYSMLTPDGDFINNMSVANPATPNTWTKTVGKDNTGATLSTNYLQSGVVDVAEFDSWKSIIGESEDENNVSPKTPYQFISEQSASQLANYNYLSDDTKVLLITNYPAISKAQSNSAAYTAVGYTAKSSMAIELGTYYELKVWVYTDLVNFDFESENKVSSDPIDFGARIVVTGVGDNNYIQNINTNKQWVEYTFAIIGHEYRTRSIGLELWLGNGVEGENKLACGTVLFDNVRLIKKGAVTEANRGQIVDQYNSPAFANPETTKVIDVKTLTDSSLLNNTIKNPNFEELDENGLPKDWELNKVNDIVTNVSLGSNKVNNPDVIVDVIDVASQNAQTATLTGDSLKTYWQNNFGIDENPGVPYETLDNILMINNVHASAFELKLPTEFDIKANLQYRLGLWVKTQGIEDGKGATLTLMNTTDDKAIHTFKTVNTSSYENEITNGYAEYVFYVQGSNFVSSTLDGDTIKASLVVSLGSGNALDSSSYVSGALFIANVNLEQVTYSEYNKASSTSNDYVKATSLKASLGTVSNGSFNSFEYEEDKIDAETGRQKDFLKPSNWTLNSSVNKDDVKSGVVNTNDTDFINATFGTNYNIYTAFASANITKPIDFGKPNVLAIDVVNPTKASLIYSSSSISLSKDTYYIFKMYAMVDGTKAQVAVEANNNSVPMYYTLNPTADRLWNEITFYVKTGSLASPSITIKIYAGDYNTDNAAKYEEGTEPKYQGKIFVDSVTYYTIDEDKFVEGTNSTCYTVDSFNTTSLPTTVIGPSSSMWTGAGEKNSSSNNRASEENYQYAGIIVKASSEPNTFKKTQDVVEKDEEGNDKTVVKTIEGSELTSDMIWVNNDEACMIINNQKASYYSYKNKNSITLDKNSYYKLTLDARTLGIDEGKGAVLTVENGNSEKFEIVVNTEYKAKLDSKGNYDLDADGKVVYEKVASSNWTTYTFYFKTAESANMTSVYLTMALGTKDAPVQGTAFFDNVSLEKLTSDSEFKAAYKSVYEVDDNGDAVVDEDGKYVTKDGSDEYLLTNRVIRADDAKKEDDKKDDEEEPAQNKTNNFMWLYISSIVIAAVMIIVIAIYLIRKYVPKTWFKRKKNVDYSRPQEKEDKKAKDTKDSSNFKD